MSGNNDEKKQKSKMLEIRDILKNQVHIYSDLHNTLSSTSKGFDKIDDAYTSYGSEIGISSSHITKLKKREFYENLFIYIGFVFFFSCVVYILLKRFPIHHILYFIYYAVDYILSFISIAYANLSQHIDNILIHVSNRNISSHTVDYNLFNTTADYIFVNNNSSLSYNNIDL